MKIDKEIIDTIDVDKRLAPLTEIIILLANSGGKRCGEGVERKEQADFLKPSTATRFRVLLHLKIHHRRKRWRSSSKQTRFQLIKEGFHLLWTILISRSSFRFPKTASRLAHITVGGVLEVIEMILLLGVVDPLLRLLNKELWFHPTRLFQRSPVSLFSPKEEEESTPRAWDEASSS